MRVNFWARDDCPLSLAVVSNFIFFTNKGIYIQQR